jgi:peptide deformylase
MVGDAILRSETEEVTLFDDTFRQFLADLLFTMYLRDGIGLAAPQVGSRLRVFAVDPDHAEEKKRNPMFFVNPRIVESEGNQSYEEGCISLPEIYERVKRPSRVVIEAQNEHGETFRHEAEGYFATVLQHEYDHLEGILFTDRLPKLVQLTLRKRIKDLECQAVDGVNFRPDTD